MGSQDTQTRSRAVLISPEAYTSEAYARAEDDKLWGRAWQVACREEEIPHVGDYVTYDIVKDSIIVVRVAPDRIAAYYNVCRHRGRRLTEGCGHAAKFFCRYHGWKWRLDGENEEVLWGEDYEGALSADDLRLQQVKVGTWGGYVFINMDPNCEPLAEFLGEAADILNPIELDKMRYRWRRWLHFPCNWKTAVEAFIEGYHVVATHPQLTRTGGNRPTWSKAYGKHGVFGSEVGAVGGEQREVRDMREAMAAHFNHLWETLNAMTTQTIVDAANALVDELPANADQGTVAAHMMRRAASMDAARGVIWPKLDAQQVQKAGTGWHIFPNTVILHGPTYALCYRARPNGYDPDSCVFEVYVLERFPEGQEPKPENLYRPIVDEAHWVKILTQDFSNMPEVQRGMHSRGFPGARPNPKQEATIINFHAVLARYMNGQ